MQSIHKKSFAAEQLAKRHQKNPTTIAIIVIAVVIAVSAVGYALYIRFSGKNVSTETVNIRSIAILPFECHSDNPDDINFTNSMHDLLIKNLSRVCSSSVRVISRGSCETYRDNKKTYPEIAQELDVDALIEGSVYSSENKVRITVQLIAMNPERHLWEDDYTREMRDVFSLQNEVTRAIAREIKVTISNEEENRLANAPTVNPQAYKLYAQGLYYYLRTNYDKARENIEKAVEIEPEFSKAMGLLSIIYAMYNNENAQSTADKALEIGTDFAEPHIAYALINQRSYRWLAAETEYKKAIALDPSNSDAYFRYATLLRIQARYQDAIQTIKIGQMIDPFYSNLYGVAVAVYTAMNRFDDAEEQYQQCMEIAPDNDYVKQHYGRMLYKQGKYKESMEIFKGTIFGGKERFSYIYALSGHREEAKKTLEYLLENYKNLGDLDISPCWIVFIYTALGDINNAFNWLERISNESNWYIMFAKTDFEFDPLRSEPRFKEILKKINLAD